MCVPACVFHILTPTNAYPTSSLFLSLKEKGKKKEKLRPKQVCNYAPVPPFRHQAQSNSSTLHINSPRFRIQWDTTVGVTRPMVGQLPPPTEITPLFSQVAPGKRIICPKSLTSWSLMFPPECQDHCPPGPGSSVPLHESPNSFSKLLLYCFKQSDI